MSLESEVRCDVYVRSRLYVRCVGFQVRWSGISGVQCTCLCRWWGGDIIQVVSCFTRWHTIYMHIDGIYIYQIYDLDCKILNWSLFYFLIWELFMLIC